MRKEIKQITAAATMALILNAYSGGDTATSTILTTSTPSVSGILTDAPVEGAKYICGNITKFTGKDGSFFCKNTPIQFYVGSVKLGEIQKLPQDAYVTPQDLANTQRDVFNDDVSNIAIFLQSLDNDGEMKKSITLDKNLIEKLDKEDTQLQEMTHTELIELLDTIGVANIVDKDDALAHLHQHMEALSEHAVPGDVPTSTAENTDELGDSDTLESLPQTDNTETSENLISTPIPEETDNNDVLVVPDSIGETPSADDVPEVDTLVPEEETDSAEEIPNTTEEIEVPTTVTETLDDSVKQAYLDVINEARSEGRECGEYGYFEATSALTWNEKLYATSYEHSKDMAISNTFSHTGSGTKSDETAEALHPGTRSSVSERIEHNGYTNWRRYGENIAAGTSMGEAVEAMEGWLTSPGHCKNIMKPEFKEVGMAIYYNEDSHYKHYWTQDFGTR